MTARDMLAAPRRWVRPAIAAAVVPAIVGVVAVFKGYPLPVDGREFVAVAGSGILLGLLGIVGWWLSERGRPAAVVIAVAGVAGGVGWSLFRPGVTAARVGGEVILTGDPILARFVGVTPWLLLVVGIVGVAEPVVPVLKAFVGSEAAASRRRTRRGALRFGVLSGVVLAFLSVLPVYLIADGFSDVLFLGFSIGGEFVGMLVVAYLFARHHLVLPVFGVGVITSAAAVAVATGGSPVGYPMAWSIWLLLGVLLGVIEAVGWRLVSAVW
ncbi:hypothetical protein [Halogeometricum borinquense]|uniref:hypothetical protein n=1 Tax=Halogeometricum borinquense TaxID=60847 RepID=UPI0034157AA6